MTNTAPLTCKYWIVLYGENVEEPGYECGEPAEWACGDDLRYCHTHGQWLLRRIPLHAAEKLGLRLIKS